MSLGFIRGTRFVLLAALTATPAAGALLQLTMNAVFTPDTVTVGGVHTSIYTLTVTNPNDVAISNVDIGATFAPGIVKDSVGQGTCGTLAVTSGGTGTFHTTDFDVRSNSLPAFTSCYQSINVHASIIGEITQISDAVTSTQLGTGPTASATLTSNAVSEAPAPPTLITMGSGLLALLSRRLRSRL